MALQKNALALASWGTRTPQRVEVEDLAPRPLVEALLADYPSLELETGLLRFAIHVLRTPTRRGEIVPVPNGLMAEIFGQSRLAANRRFPSLASITALADALDAAVPGRPPVHVTLYPYDFRRRLSYAVEFVGVAPEVKEMAEESRDVPPDNRITLDGWVRVEPNGSVHGLYHDAPAVREAMESSLRSNEGAADLTLRLQEYLNGHATAVFAPLRSTLEERETGAFILESYRDGGRRGSVVAVVHDVLRQPVPIYQTSPKTPRLHAVRRNATGLPSALRQHVTERLGWVELDLAHAQLACNAAAWGVQDVLDTLGQSGYEVWPDLMGHLGAASGLKDSDPPLYKALKDVLKPTVHGVSFGMRKWKVKRFGLEAEDIDEPQAADTLAAACGKSIAEAGRLLTDHPIVGAMLEAREEQREIVYAEGGREDVFGTWRPLESKGDWKKVLARCAQAHEMMLLEPVVDDAVAEQAKARPRYRIVLWQHDGFTVSPKGGQEAERIAVTRRLCRLVECRAAEMGVPTQLKVDVGPQGY